jgi:hypothetical protein
VVLFIAPDSDFDFRYIDILSSAPYDTAEYENAVEVARQWGYEPSLVKYDDFHCLFLHGDDRDSYDDVHEGIWCKLRDWSQWFSDCRGGKLKGKRSSYRSHGPMEGLKNYVVKLSDGACHFHWRVMAVNREHARRQAIIAHPQAVIMWVSAALATDIEGAD